jgi:hypothetical protein
VISAIFYPPATTGRVKGAIHLLAAPKKQEVYQVRGMRALAGPLRGTLQEILNFSNLSGRKWRDTKWLWVEMGNVHWRG